MENERMKNRRGMGLILLALAAAAAVLAGALLLLGRGAPAAGTLQPAQEPAAGSVASLYRLTVTRDYGFAAFLDQGGAASAGELMEFLNARGAKLTALYDPAQAGSAFTALTDDNGHRILARNRDRGVGRICLIETRAGQGRHATVSTVDLAALGLGPGTDVAGVTDKALSLAAPYLPVDGVNDAGLACALCASGQGGGEPVPTHQDTGAPDLTATALVRLLLDYAGDVDEAIALAGQYDLHDPEGGSVHCMVADARGDSAVLEWLGESYATDVSGAARTLRVTRVNAAPFQTVTDYVLYESYYAGAQESDLAGLDRSRYLYSVLSGCSGRLTGAGEAMDLLEELSYPGWSRETDRQTGHSVVYDLTGRSGLWVDSGNYDREGYAVSLAG